MVIRNKVCQRRKLVKTRSKRVMQTGFKIEWEGEGEGKGDKENWLFIDA